MRALRSAALLAAIAGLSAGPSAQGLADAARRASAAPQPSAKKYTNDDVEAARSVPTAPAGTAAPPEAASDAKKAESAKTPDTAAPAAEEVKATEPDTKKTPPYIVNRIAQLKSQLQNKQKLLNDLQARGASADADADRASKQIANLQRELTILEALR